MIAPASATWDGSTTTEWTSGSGTAVSPFEIATEVNLAYLAQLVNSGTDYSGQYFKLTADLDLDNKPWTPIGNAFIDSLVLSNGTPFNGTFDGDNHTISNLSISMDTNKLSGLFGYTNESAVIKNLGLINVNVSGNNGVGGLVGGNKGTIENCYVTGSVEGDYYVGGLAGQSFGGTIENCYVTGSVEGDYYVGGLVGDNQCTIENCYATGTVSGAYDVGGGLIGVNAGTISNCYATGTVSGSREIGGLVGYNSDRIENCYATGDVSGTYDSVGGLVGWNDEGTIENCYATSDVNGAYFVGGLVGDNSGTIENCYATSDVSGTYYSVGGFVGRNNEGTVTNSVALNQYVNRTSGDGTSFGRVVGYNYLGTLTNNYAWEGMLVKGKIVTSSDKDSYEGEDISSTNVWDKGVNEGIWATLTTFTSANWTKNSYENFKLLILTGSTNTISDALYLKPLKVTYNGNGNTSGAVPTDANGYSKNKEVTVSENTGSLEKTDYIFGGWSKIQNGDAVTKFTITEDTTLYAKWLQQFNVTFNNNSGTGTMTNQTFVEGIPRTLKQNTFTKDGYDFIGWATSADGAKVYNDKQSITITADTTLYAVWQIKSNPTPQPINSGGSTDTGSGNYKIYERSVTDGGYVSFGSSPYVIGVELPKGSNGQVILTIDSEKDWLKDESSEYLFDISVHELGDGTAEIKFKLSADKLAKLGLSPADICLYHSVKGQWVKLETVYEVGEDGNIYYTAYTDSFSPFKIVVEENSAVGFAGAVKETVAPVETKETEAVPTYVEPAVPVQTAKPEKTASPMGVLGLITGLGVAVAVLRRK